VEDFIRHIRKMKYRIRNTEYDSIADEYNASLHCYNYFCLEPNGRIVSYVGSITTHEDCFSREHPVSYGKNIGEPSYVAEFWTGLIDINGIEIFEGDILVEYPENRQKVRLNAAEYGETPVYEVIDEMPRRALQDVIVNKGKVVFTAPEFRLELEAPKESGVCSVSLHSGSNYEVLN
jgi:hypothetical protein